MIGQNMDRPTNNILNPTIAKATITAAATPNTTKIAPTINKTAIIGANIPAKKPSNIPSLL